MDDSLPGAGHNHYPDFRLFLMLQNISVIAVLILVVATTILLVFNSWRWISIAWVFQVFCVFWLTSLSWSVPESAVKLVGGWIAIAIVSSTHPVEIFEKDTSLLRDSFGFRFILAGMGWLLSFSIASEIQSIIPGRIEIIWGGLLLIISGILQVGLSANYLRSIIGIIMFISGFEILYASIENSVLVSGLLTFLTIGLSCLTLYFQPKTIEGDI